MSHTVLLGEAAAILHRLAHYAPPASSLVRETTGILDRIERALKDADEAKARTAQCVENEEGGAS